MDYSDVICLGTQIYEKRTLGKSCTNPGSWEDVAKQIGRIIDKVEGKRILENVQMKSMVKSLYEDEAKSYYK